MTFKTSVYGEQGLQDSNLPTMPEGLGFEHRVTAEEDELKPSLMFERATLPRF
jgi:hypothetical protein